MKDRIGQKIEPKDIVAWTVHKGGDIHISMAVEVKDSSVKLAPVSHVSSYTRLKRDNYQVLKLSKEQLSIMFKNNPTHKAAVGQQIKDFKL